MNYTKGKWKAQNNGYRFDILDEEGRNILASSRGMEELEANARLIAQAPEIHKLLKFLASYPSIMGYFKPEKQREIRSVLAKVEIS